MQTSQSQPIIGTPMLVPVPRSVIQAVGEGSVMNANSAEAHLKPAPENRGEMGMRRGKVSNRRRERESAAYKKASEGRQPRVIPRMLTLRRWPQPPPNHSPVHSRHPRS